MREIQFRVWTGDGMVYNIERTYDWETLKLDNNKYLMQYTGLHDRNGKEIYEGDIVEFGTYNKEYENTENDWLNHISVCPVEYINGGFGVEGNTFDYWETEMGYDYIKVIGNIYKNSNLLEK